MRDVAFLVTHVTVLVLAACTASTPIGIGQIPPDRARVARLSDAPPRDYVIAPGDIIEFRVTGASDLDTTQAVRADGRISLPFIADPVVAGLTLQEVRSRLTQEYVSRGILKRSPQQLTDGQSVFASLIAAPSRRDDPRSSPP